MKTKRKTKPEQANQVNKVKDPVLSLENLNTAVNEAAARGYSTGEKHGYTRGFEVGTTQVFAGLKSLGMLDEYNRRIKEQIALALARV